VLLEVVTENVRCHLRSCGTLRYGKKYATFIGLCKNACEACTALHYVCWKMAIRLIILLMMCVCVCVCVCVQVFFLPMSSTIMMCFKDDSIFAWDSETMQSLYHLHVPTSGEKSPGFKAFAVSKYALCTDVIKHYVVNNNVLHSVFPARCTLC